MCTAQLHGVTVTCTWQPWQGKVLLDEDGFTLTLGPLRYSIFQNLIFFLKRCFYEPFRDSSARAEGLSPTISLRVCYFLRLLPLHLPPFFWKPCLRWSILSQDESSLVPSCRTHIWPTENSGANCSHPGHLLEFSSGSQCSADQLFQHESDTLASRLSRPRGSREQIPSTPATCSKELLLNCLSASLNSQALLVGWRQRGPAVGALLGPSH